MIHIQIPQKPTYEQYGLTEESFQKDIRTSKRISTLTSFWFWVLVFCIACGIAVYFIPGVVDSFGIIGTFFIGLIEGFCIIWGLSLVLYALLFVVGKVIEWGSPSPRKRNRQPETEKEKLKRERRLEKQRRKESRKQSIKKFFLPNHVAVDEYNNAMKNYQSEMDSISRRYKGIEQYSYNDVLFSKAMIKETLPLLQSCCVETIERLNYEADRDWWIKLSPESFEKEIANWYRRRGYDAKTTQFVGDGGIDVIIEKDGIKSYVQCKHFVGGKVDVKVVRELCGVMAADKIPGGVIACLNGLSSDAAYDFARQNNIQVITLNDLTTRNKVAINAVDYPAHVDVGPFKVIKDVFETKNEAESFALRFYPGMTSSIMEMSPFYYLIESEKEYLIEDYRNKSRIIRETYSSRPSHRYYKPYYGRRYRR